MAGRYTEMVSFAEIGKRVDLNPVVLLERISTEDIKKWNGMPCALEGAKGESPVANLVGCELGAPVDDVARRRKRKRTEQERSRQREWFRNKRKRETPEERQKRLQRYKDYNKRRKLNETPEQRRRRLEQMRKRIANETSEERQKRLEAARAYYRKKRMQLLEKRKLYKWKRMQTETVEQREERLERARLYYHASKMKQKWSAVVGDQPLDLSRSKEVQDECTSLATVERLVRSHKTAACLKIHDQLISEELNGQPVCS